MRTHVTLVITAYDHPVVSEGDPGEPDEYDSEDTLIISFSEGVSIVGNRSDVVRWVDELSLVARTS